MSDPTNKRDPFGFAKFEIEHALNIYAHSHFTFPAQSIYDEKCVEMVRQCSDSFHIYLIGYVPRIVKKGFAVENGVLIITVHYLDELIDLKFEVPVGLKLMETDGGYFFENEKGDHIPPPDGTVILDALSSRVGGCPFKIKYIGQSYGDDGCRDAIDRLLKHETLQKIALKGVPDGWVLQVVLLEIHEDTRIISVFLPKAANRDDDGSRRKAGLDKLFGTTEAERVSLYEASLIRYFAPEFNKTFKDSFPSTNLKILQDCYKKDFLAVIAEICFDEFPYFLESESVKSAYEHIITHDLQKDDQRQAFFGYESIGTPSPKPEKNS